MIFEIKLLELIEILTKTKSSTLLTTRRLEKNCLRTTYLKCLEIPGGHGKFSLLTRYVSCVWATAGAHIFDTMIVNINDPGVIICITYLMIAISFFLIFGCFFETIWNMFRMFVSEATGISVRTGSRVEARPIRYKYVSHTKMEKCG